MSLRSQPISGFHGGVSQQSPTLRADNQCEEAINCSFSIAEGSSKRPPMEVVNLLSSTDLSTGFSHWITDKNGDQYLLHCGSETLSVYRLSDGQKLTVLNDTGQTYLNSTDPGKYFRALNVKDKTYIVNTETQVTASASTAAGSIGGFIQTINDDGLTPTSNTIYEVSGHDSVDHDIYYAKYTGNNVFVEWIKPGISDELEPTTMPHVLTLIFDEVDPNGVRFEFEPVTWEKQKVGDEKSNKMPSFVGTTINGIFYANGRLGFLTPDAVCMSEVDEELNFFKTTVTDLLDTARIDLTVKGGTTSPLRWAKPLGKNIVLFTEDRQYNLSGDPVITPGNVRIDLATKFETSRHCEPTNAGSNLYYAVESGNNTKINEMYIQDLTVTTDAADVTAHVNRYIPKNVTMLEAQNSLNVLLAYSEETPNKLWCYHYHYNGEQKIQSAWGQWEFNENLAISSMKVVDNYLYAVFTFTYTIDELLSTTTTETFLGRINLKINDPGEYNDSFDETICLDFVTQVSKSYDGPTNQTLMLHNFPVMCPELRDDLVVIVGNGHSNPGRMFEYNTVYTFQPFNNPYGFYVAQEWWMDGTVFCGVGYDQKMELSRQYPRGGSNSVSMTTARMQIRNITVSYLNTVAFDVSVKVEGADEIGGTFITELVEQYTARTLGSEYFNVNTPNRRTGSQRFPVLGNAMNTKITLVNPHWNSANWVRAELEAYVTSRTRR